MSAVDFQKAGRKPGTDVQETMLDIVADYTLKHAKAYKRYIEAAYGDALFRGLVQTPYTQEAPVIDYADSFDAPMMTDTITLSNGSTDALEVFNGFWIKLALQQMVCGRMFAVSSVLPLQVSIIVCVSTPP